LPTPAKTSQDDAYISITLYIADLGRQ